ncbi:nucleotide cyclase [Dunaliella salina]|uniref:Nucleotide cyclase n=1 Tax=Dunaliella salina TaxID=3046 RepID=A0ABQ7H522_DUNSA|nr:nucleotide cyclase [Dunaliella salina]|eukprot:KAF5841955.1 nucleotide cyclase [Dunaliella salina]
MGAFAASAKQRTGSIFAVNRTHVVSNVVAPRVLLFRWPLAITAQWEKLAPGFFDAPGASNLSFPNMLDPGITGEFRKSRPKVVIAFASLEGYSQICATDLEVAQDVLSSYNACVRETLAICEGYECKEINGSFMAAFADGCKAMEWALTLHLALAAAAIAEEVLDRCKLPNYLWQAVAQQLTKGVHARVGIYGGTIDRVTPNHKTGRADYFGQPVNRAARLMSAASGGQTLCEQRFMSDVLSEWANRSEPRVGPCAVSYAFSQNDAERMSA